MLDLAQPTNVIVFSLFFPPPRRRPPHRTGALWVTAKQVPPVWQVGCDSSKMLYDLRGRENNINGNSPSNTLTGMNRVPPSPSKWTCIDRRNPWINLALIDFFSFLFRKKKISNSEQRWWILQIARAPFSFCFNLRAARFEEAHPASSSDVWAEKLGPACTRASFYHLIWRESIEKSTLMSAA